MKTLIGIVAIFIITVGSCGAYFLTFEEPGPPGAPEYVHGLWYYRTVYNIWFDGSFESADFSSSSWGSPRSGSYVLVNRWSIPLYESMVKFAYPNGDMSSMRYFSGYFSTETDCRIRVEAIRNIDYNPVVVGSVEIGGVGESWHNRFVEINPTGGVIDYFLFKAVGGSGLLGYCADDITFLPVPEPASLTALAVGLVGVIARRRR